MEKFDLSRFLEAQEQTYKIALSEILAGKKVSHWMWFIFPQYEGLGFSENAVYYSIKSQVEATEYLRHDILGLRLKEITLALLQLDATDPSVVLGSPDDLKLQSCMTLFSQINHENPCLFKRVLRKFFRGVPCLKTLELLNRIS